MIITLASSKGGVGKSTTTAALAGALASAGYRAHIVDLDNNHTVSRWLGDGNGIPRLSVSVADPQDLTEHLAEVARKHSPDVTLIDIAGTYERALTVAVARAHLTIIPAGPSEADIFEAARVARHIRSVFQAFGRDPLYRLLLTRVQPLASHAQVHACAEIERLKLPAFETAIRHRAAYVEIGLSGLAPHFADTSRSTVAKAVAELDAVVAEITALIGAGMEPVAEKGAA
jgi:chromosome partitioning protein